MDKAIKPDIVGLQGYFYGKNHPKEIVIDDFYEKEQKNDSAIGCLLVIRRMSYPAIQKDYLPVMNRFDCSIIYCSEDENIYIFTKNEHKRYPDTSDKITSVPLIKMKEWTRRKRD